MANDVSLPRISSATGELKTDRGRDARRHTSIDTVIRGFPFRGYMEPMRDAYEAISANCLRLLPPGSRILDFGAGPCEKAAILSLLGYQCTAVDDFKDDWHQIAGNREKMLDFAKVHNVELIVNEGVPSSLPKSSFAMVMMHDVIEHFADSPRALLIALIELLQPGGYLYVTAPNAVNLRKRLLVLGGRTNYPRYPAYFWSGEVWRGHKREYVKDDFALLCKFLGLRPVLLKGEHHRMRALPPWARGIFRFTIGRIDSLRDTVALIAQKPREWTPVEISSAEYRQIQRAESFYPFE
ncbi:MAG TPA: methyltransferase domain-containing protein [Candidatus Acidoferrales bacterium]